MKGIRRKHTTKVSRKSKSKKVSFGSMHKAMAEHWDKNLTTQQNYEHLGFTRSLKGLSGGSGLEAKEIIIQQEHLANLRNNVEFRTLDSIDVNPKKSKKNTKTFQFTPLENVSQVEPKAVQIGRSINLKVRKESAVLLSATAQQIHTALDLQAANPLTLERVQSHQETLVFQQLRAKYGEDYGAMARNVKMNVFQLSAGVLKRKMMRASKRESA